ncbi:antichymotrypsin-2-like isoform X2 [Arctopsyche grandis]|uniref:antichymotrypsin-2-like isoform X2 n=1 Tax=Arctopsyche grandis TaxID=121162 RepID=UPI00406D6B02
MKKISEFSLIFFFLVVSVVLAPSNQTTNTINQFSLEFYKETANKNTGKSLILSPLSAEVLLGLLSTGARGDTQKEISDALHLPDSEIIKSTFQTTMRKLSNIQGVVLNIANKVYVKDGEAFKLDPVFKSVAVDQFSSDVENIDFSKATRAANTINEWVESKTNNKIKDFVSPDIFDENTRIMLVNAIYFQGNWENPFDKRSVQKTKFKKNKIDKVEVDIMYQTDDFPYANLPEWNSEILALPYKNNDTYLAIILPRKVDGLAALEEKLYGANMVNIINKMRKTEVHVGIPKFKIESTIDLKHVLPELGIKLIFNKQKADLHNLLKNPEQLFVSDAKQKAFIEVNEHGTEAGVVTGFFNKNCSIKKQKLRVVADSARIDEEYFTADHPFFYMLMNKDDIIFCGKYIGD